MARSYRSNPSRVALDLGEPVITGGPAVNLGPAAGLINLSNSFKSLSESRPDFTEISTNAMQIRSTERAQDREIAGNLEVAQITAATKEKQAQIQADARVKAGEAEARSSMMGSVFGALGSVGGLLLSNGNES